MTRQLTVQCPRTYSESPWQTQKLLLIVISGKNCLRYHTPQEIHTQPVWLFSLSLTPVSHQWLRIRSITTTKRNSRNSTQLMFIIQFAQLNPTHVTQVTKLTTTAATQPNFTKRKATYGIQLECTNIPRWQTFLIFLCHVQFVWHLE